MNINAFCGWQLIQDCKNHKTELAEFVQNYRKRVAETKTKRVAKTTPTAANKTTDSKYTHGSQLKEGKTKAKGKTHTRTHVASNVWTDQRHIQEILMKKKGKKRGKKSTKEMIIIIIKNNNKNNKMTDLSTIKIPLNKIH